MLSVNLISLPNDLKQEIKSVPMVDGNQELQRSGSILQNGTQHRPDHLNNITVMSSQEKVVSNGSVDGAEIKSSDGTRSYINLIVDELVATEESYVKDLAEVVKGYMNIFNRKTTVSENDCFLLFGNIQEILQFNRSFMENLRSNRHCPVEVAKCFVNQAEGFMIYSDYCTNYPKSVKVWTEIINDKSIVAYLEQQQIALGHPLPLSAYLFKPVQRILKYHLLLQNIVANHDADAVGHDVIVTALNCMVEIAHHINEMKRHNERLLRTQELQAALASNLSKDIKLLSFGDLILEDEFRVSGASSERLVILFARALLIAKKVKDGSLITKAIIRMSNLSLVENVAREPCHLSVAPFNDCKQTFHLQAKCLDQKQIWCQEIKKLMIENHPSAIPERARQVLGIGSNPDSTRQRSGSLQLVLASRQRSHEVPKCSSEKRPSRKGSRDLLSTTAADDTHVETLSTEHEKLVRKRSSSHNSLVDLVNGGQTSTDRGPLESSAQSIEPRRSTSLDSLHSPSNTQLISSSDDFNDDSSAMKSGRSDVTDGDTAETIYERLAYQFDEKSKSVAKDLSGGPNIRGTVMALELESTSAKVDVVKRRGALRREKRDSPEPVERDTSVSASIGSKDTQTSGLASTSKDSSSPIPASGISKEAVTRVTNTGAKVSTVNVSSVISVNRDLPTNGADSVDKEEDGDTVDELNSDGNGLHPGWPQNHVLQLARAFSYRAKKNNSTPRKLSKKMEKVSPPQSETTGLLRDMNIATGKNVKAYSIASSNSSCEKERYPEDGVVKNVRDTVKQINMNSASKHFVFRNDSTSSELPQTPHGCRSGSELPQTPHGCRSGSELPQTPHGCRSGSELTQTPHGCRSGSELTQTPHGCRSGSELPQTPHGCRSGSELPQTPHGCRSGSELTQTPHGCRSGSELTQTPHGCRSGSELPQTPHGCRSGSVQLETVTDRPLIMSQSTSVGKRGRTTGSLIQERMKVFEAN